MVVITEDFESYADSTAAAAAGWTNAMIDQDPIFSTVLGRFNKFDEDPYKDFTGIPTDAAFIQVSLDFLEIDDWEGSDSFCIYIDGELIDLGTFDKEKDEGVRSGTTTGGISWNSYSRIPPVHIGFNQNYVDQVHRVVARVPKAFFADGTITLRFTTKDVTVKNNESSGVDNIIITAFFDCGACVSSKVVAEDTFESYSSTEEVVAAGWVNGELETGDTAAFTQFLGRYDNEDSTYDKDPFKVFHVPAAAEYVMVEVDFYEIDDWDGSDCLYVFLNEQEVDARVFNTHIDEMYKTGVTTNGIVWMIDSSPNPPAQIGFGAANDQIHHFTARVPSYLFADGVLIFRLAIRIDALKDNESAGFDNVKITAVFDCGECVPNEVISFEDFESADESDALSGWVNGKLDSDDGFTQFLGRYGKDDSMAVKDPVKYYFVPPSAESVTVEFDFYEIDNWEHPDCIFVFIGTETLNILYYVGAEDDGVKTGVDGTISWKSESMGPPAHIGFMGEHKDQKHHITAEVPASYFANGLLRLSFGTRVNGIGTAGYDNIKITANRSCVRRLAEEAEVKCDDSSIDRSVAQLPVDHCTNPAGKESPINVLEQTGTTVTFSVLQSWEGCGISGFLFGTKVSQMAVDYADTNGDLTCTRFTDVTCGETTTLTALCENGEAVVDLYVGDERDSKFQQEDGSSVVVPTACDMRGNFAGCHYRYAVKCAPEEPCKNQHIAEM